MMGSLEAIHFLELAVAALEEIARDPHADRRSRERAHRVLAKGATVDLRRTSSARVSALAAPQL